jgi:integrase
MRAIQDVDIADHLDWCADLRGLTPATVRARAWVLNRLSASVDRPLRQLEIGHIQTWEQTVVAGLAPQSRKAYTQHVRSFYRWMVTTGRMDEDPTVMLTRPKVPRPLPRPIREADLRRALDAASPKLAAIMTLMADSGLRCLEVAQLMWSDIELADGQMWLIVRNGKGRRDRVVPIGESVTRALRRHGTPARGPVFLGRDGHQMRPNSVSQTVNQHLSRLGIPATAHKLRARYATRAVEVLNMQDVAELCGWESLETARHYIKPDKERSLRLVLALDALALPPQRTSGPDPAGPIEYRPSAERTAS